MPELPEVETTVCTLAPRITGQIIREVRLLSPKILGAPAAALRRRLVGHRIQAVRRRGKFILLELDGPPVAIHLGMTGALVWKAAPGPHARVVLVLERGELVFDDPRQFGRIDLGDRVERLGPDALAITAEEFAARLAGRRGRIKPLLLNQRILSGVGNIYADESLYRARIHPRALASRLSPARIERLCAALHEVLASAVASGGSSISDYRDGDGNPGAFQFEHRVYGREGEPCAACGTPIRRIVIAQRSAHYCPKCQRA